MARVYQNVSFADLMGFASVNPRNGQGLAPIRAESTTDTAMEGLPHYSICNLMPASPLSVIACIADPTMYSLTALNLRIQQLSELTTMLQLRTEELKGGTLLRKRKAIHDLIGAAFNGSRLDAKDCLVLYQGLAHLMNVHFILLQDATAAASADRKEETMGEVTGEAVARGSIHFSSDPARWSHPIWIADFRGQWVAVPSDRTASFADWLGHMEEKWTIEWPIVDGTKAEIVAQLQALPGWKDTDRKHLKDTLAQRLGRLQALAQLHVFAQHPQKDF